jgi:anti-sigma B factor antagonist
MMFATEGSGNTPLSVSIRTDDDRSLLLVTGEVDLASAGVLRSGVDHALSLRPSMLTIDLAGVRFLDSSGLSALLYARRQAIGAGGTCLVVNCQPPVQRTMTVAGVWTLLTGKV